MGPGRHGVYGRFGFVCWLSVGSGGGAAAFQVSVDPTGVTTVRSMVMALPIGYRISSGAAEHVAMHLACMGAKSGPISFLVSDSAAVGRARLHEMSKLRDGKNNTLGFGNTMAGSGKWGGLKATSRSDKACRKVLKRSGLWKLVGRQAG